MYNLNTFDEGDKIRKLSYVLYYNNYVIIHILCYMGYVPIYCIFFLLDKKSQDVIMHCNFDSRHVQFPVTPLVNKHL